jgi:hypothetical protein
MVWRGEEDVHSGGQLRCEHDADGDEYSYEALTPGKITLGQQRSQQRRQRIRHGRGHVHYVLVQPAHELHQHVLRQFGGVVRNIPEQPAVQKQVGVQHVPGLQGLARAIGVDGPRPRQLQVGRKGGDHAEDP